MKTSAQTKTLSLPFTWVSLKKKELSWTLGLGLLSVILPALLAHTPQNQWITGTLVNALLFLAAWRLGLANSFLVAIIPSTIALMRGLLPAPLAIMLPWIILGNLTLIATFTFLKKRQLLAMIIASSVKFLLIYAAAWFYLSSMKTPLMLMMQWPQLITALAGGFLALGLIKNFSKK